MDLTTARAPRRPRPPGRRPLRPLATATAATLLLALASAAFSVARAQPAPPPPPAPPGGGHHRMAPGPGPDGLGAPMLSERLLDAAGASAEQKARVRQIMDAARDDLHRQHEAARPLQQQLAQALTAPQLDPAAAEALRQQLQAGHDTASKRRLQALLDASAVLTPEQRQKLGERLAQRREQAPRHPRERRAPERPQ